jgi:hypothetical protein
LIKFTSFAIFAYLPIFSGFSLALSPSMAFSWQFSWHSPQSVHLAASITYLSLPSLTAPAGQISAQVPQEIQLSVIFRAISALSRLIDAMKNDQTVSYLYAYSAAHLTAGSYAAYTGRLKTIMEYRRIKTKKTSRLLTRATGTGHYLTGWFSQVFCTNGVGIIWF